MVCAAIGEAVNQPWIRVEVEDDRLIGREERIEIPIRQSMRMFGVWHQTEQVDYIDEPDLEVGELLPQKSDGGESFLCWDVTATDDDCVGFRAFICTRPLPDAQTLCAVCDSGFDVEILQV